MTPEELKILRTLADQMAELTQTNAKILQVVQYNAARLTIIESKVNGIERSLGTPRMATSDWSSESARDEDGQRRESMG